jgi:hypothetical protein
VVEGAEGAQKELSRRESDVREGGGFHPDAGSITGTQCVTHDGGSITGTTSPKHTRW